MDYKGRTFEYGLFSLLIPEKGQPYTVISFKNDHHQGRSWDSDRMVQGVDELRADGRSESFFNVYLILLDSKPSFQKIFITF